MRPDVQARACDALHGALEPILAGTVQDRVAKDAAVLSALAAHRGCYLEYAPLITPAPTPEMSEPLRRYYIYRRRLHEYLTEPHDGSLLEVRKARELHECAYREYLAEQGRGTCGWVRGLAARLANVKLRTLRLIMEYPDTHQLAAACERIDGAVHIPAGIRDLLHMEALCTADVRLVEYEFTVLYERVIEKKVAPCEQLQVADSSSPPIVSKIRAAPRPYVRQSTTTRCARLCDRDSRDTRWSKDTLCRRRDTRISPSSSRSRSPKRHKQRPRSYHRNREPTSSRVRSELARRPRVRSSRSRRRVVCYR